MLVFELVVRIVGVYFSIGLALHLIMCTLLTAFDSDRDRSIDFKTAWLDTFNSREWLVSDIVLWPGMLIDVCRCVSIALSEDTETDDNSKPDTESEKGK